MIHLESTIMREIAQTLLALIIASHLACSNSRQRSFVGGNSQQTDSDQWQPIQSIPGAFRRTLVGDIGRPGPFKFQLKVPARAHAAAHRHSTEVHVKVLSGSMFIIIGEPLESSRSQHFTAGSVFVVPAHAWHEEWWNEETVLEGEGAGPMDTVYKSP